MFTFIITVMLILSVILNVALAFIIAKMAMSKVGAAIKVAKNGVEVAKRTLDHVDAAKGFIGSHAELGIRDIGMLRAAAEIISPKDPEAYMGRIRARYAEERTARKSSSFDDIFS